MGEVIVSDSAARASGLETQDLETRALDLRGKTETIDVWVVSGAT